MLELALADVTSAMGDVFAVETNAWPVLEVVKVLSVQVIFWESHCVKDVMDLSEPPRKMARLMQ